MANARQLFVNLSVKDLERSKGFFTKLGFEFNPKFTDQNAACMVVSDQCSVMLLTETYFKTFTKQPVSDPSKQTEALYAFSCGSRTEVDALVKTAVANGGKHALEPQDHGWMYGWSFYDPDGHHFEVLWMDPKAIS